ncbi:hypothetical protein FSP39_016309 [Pinctada imbricata]|uniref:Uncharacterized protein n=1 Tax=Pinctada imbricata TaxID=66713 RepID=A0AA88XMN4_PINIB|nr:hypothetical protein FSP39_016309 [Pinctada imbricata]
MVDKAIARSNKATSETNRTTDSDRISSTGNACSTESSQSQSSSMGIYRNTQVSSMGNNNSNPQVSFMGSSNPQQVSFMGNSNPQQVSFMGNSTSTPQVSFMGSNPSQVSFMGNNSNSQQAFLMGNIPMQGQMMGYNFMNPTLMSEQFFNALIDKRIQEMNQTKSQTSEAPSTESTCLSNTVVSESSKNTDNSSARKRFSRFERSSHSVSDEESNADILDVVDSNNNDFESETQSLIDTRSVRDQDTVSNLSAEEGVTSLEWRNFVGKMAKELNISLESEKDEEPFVSYVSERLMSSKPQEKHKLPLDGFAIQSLRGVDKEWQNKGRLRAFKANDDAKYSITADHFSKFCKTPHLDDNIEEGIMGHGQKSSYNAEKNFKFRNKQNVSRNQELRKVDIAARLLLREISYGSMIASYLDKVVSEEDKTEALQALLQVFHSMADATSRIIVGAVGARRSLYLQDMAFKNKATESKLLNMSTLGSDIFLGKFFDVLHSSAENMRDAKETQHLRAKPANSTNLKRKNVDQRQDEASASKYPKRGIEDKTNQRKSRSRPNRRDNNTYAQNKSKETQQLGFRPSK